MDFWSTPRRCSPAEHMQVAPRLAFCRFSYFLVVLKVTFQLEPALSDKGNVSDLSHIRKEFFLGKKITSISCKICFSLCDFLFMCENVGLCWCEKKNPLRSQREKKNWIHKTSQGSENLCIENIDRDILKNKIWLQQAFLSKIYF